MPFGVVTIFMWDTLEFICFCLPTVQGFLPSSSCFYFILQYVEHCHAFKKSKLSHKRDLSVTSSRVIPFCLSNKSSSTLLFSGSPSCSSVVAISQETPTFPFLHERQHAPYPLLQLECFHLKLPRNHSDQFTEVTCILNCFSFCSCTLLQGVCATLCATLSWIIPCIHISCCGKCVFRVNL